MVPIHGIFKVLDLNVQRDDAAQPDGSCSPHFELSRLGLSRVVYACMAFSLLVRIYFPNSSSVESARPNTAAAKWKIMFRLMTPPVGRENS